MVATTYVIVVSVPRCLTFSNHTFPLPTPTNVKAASSVHEIRHFNDHINKVFVLRRMSHIAPNFNLGCEGCTGVSNALSPVQLLIPLAFSLIVV